jgi:hypothetical protein
MDQFHSILANTIFACLSKSFRERFGLNRDGATTQQEEFKSAFTKALPINLFAPDRESFIVLLITKARFSTNAHESKTLILTKQGV